MNSVPIVTRCNGPLEVVRESIDDDRYAVAECGAAGQPKRPKFRALGSAATL